MKGEKIDQPEIKRAEKEFDGFFPPNLSARKKYEDRKAKASKGKSVVIPTD